jgi:beta-glucosidase
MGRQAWVDESVAALTLEQKVALLSGADMWRTAALDEPRVPAIRFTDGPNGARGTGARAMTSACFPSGTALGATWSRATVAAVAAAIADEVSWKGAQVLLAPTVNLHRSPLAGRNFECFSEDPLLTAELGTAYVRAVQAAGVGACVKHLVANDSEFERMTISSDLDDRTLRELYLLPFERVVADASPWAVMGAYNRVNGVYACEHRELLVELLKEEWGFDGVVISDWGAVHDTEGAANGGTDIEMPGPAQHFGRALVAAVKSGAVDAAVVDDKVRRVLRLVERSGVLDGEPPEPARSPDRPEVRALARRAAVDGIVLLTNPGGVLPLEVRDGHRLAVVGPNAASAAHQGGGSASVRSHPVTQPLDALRERAARDGGTVVHEVGPRHDVYVPGPEPSWFEAPDGEPGGVLIEYVNGDDPTGPAVSERVVSTVSHNWWRRPPGVAPEGDWSARWTGRLRVPSSGPWKVGLAAAGRARLAIDGAEVVDNWSDPEPGRYFYGLASAEVVGTVDLDADRSYDVRVELAAPPEPPAVIRLGLAPVPPLDALERAVRAAADADTAVVVVGTSADHETEGSDRETMALPGDQDELVRRVAERNPRTVVVVNSGSPVEMPWVDDVAAVVQLFFAGEELGPALADVLFGDEDPGGRLPTTFPVRYEDHPALFGYPGESGRVRYGERVFVGYRGYQARGLAPRFPFGHGLSYTTFEHGDLQVELVGDPAQLAGDHPPAVARRPPAVADVTVTVSNRGDRPGSEVVQLFVGAPPGPLARPPLELRAFEKLRLEPGEHRTVRLGLDARAFTAFDLTRAAWRAEAGPYRIVVASSGCPVAEARLELPVAVTLPVR